MEEEESADVETSGEAGGQAVGEARGEASGEAGGEGENGAEENGEAPITSNAANVESNGDDDGVSIDDKEGSDETGGIAFSLPVPPLLLVGLLM